MISTSCLEKPPQKRSGFSTVTTAPPTAVHNETLREQESKKRRHKIQANPGCAFHQHFAGPGQRPNGGTATAAGRAAEKGRAEKRRGAEFPHGVLRHGEAA